MKLNVFLGIVFILLILANVYVRPDETKLNFEFLPEMVRTASYKAFDENENFANHMTFQAPPPHTVSQDIAPDAYGASEADAIRAGEELKNPYGTEDLAAYTRGGEVFRTWCVPCHGGSGKGDGPVAMRGFPAPPPLTSQSALAMKDGRIFHVITHGQNNMPGYASQISAEDRWKAVVYVRSLQRPALAEAQAANEAAAPATAAASSAAEPSVAAPSAPAKPAAPASPAAQEVRP
ncbi:MAG: c-type cytochrome [Bryobacterales bacterium]|nr:c-type cytochrome [Bryobacterales bacterium]